MAPLVRDCYLSNDKKEYFVWLEQPSFHRGSNIVFASDGATLKDLWAPKKTKKLLVLFKTR